MLKTKKLKSRRLQSAGEMTALIDADYLVYRIGFACEEEDSLAAVLHSVKTNILEIVEESGADSVKLYLTGSNNFRNDIAVTKPYKGGRSTKPKWYDDIRKYFIDVWGAVVREDDEADDALAIAQWAGDGHTIICTVDKDLLMVPGLHYNILKQSIQTVTYFAGAYNFYRQLLTGDSVDSIPGLPRVGIKTADKLLGDADTVDDMERIVCTEYCNRIGDEWVDYLHEQARLLWMRRHEGELWNLCYEY